MKVLQDFRKSLGLSTREMAGKIGVSQSLYEKVEFGQRKPSREFLLSFKRTFPDFDVNIFFDILLHEMSREEGREGIA